MDGSSPKMVRLKEFGVWSEQTSSSGKRYYYNRESEISQWEKPTEWKEHEKSLTAKQGAAKTVKPAAAPAIKSAPQQQQQQQQQSTISRPLNNLPSTSDVATSNASNNPATSGNRQQHHTSSSTSKPSNTAIPTSHTSSQHHQNKSNGSLKRAREEERHHQHRHNQQGFNSTTPNNNSNTSTSLTLANKVSRSSNNNNGNAATPVVSTPATIATISSTRHVASQNSSNNTSRPSPSPFSTPKFGLQVQPPLVASSSSPNETPQRPPNVASTQHNAATPTENVSKSGLSSFGKANNTPLAGSQVPVGDLKEVVVATPTPVTVPNNSTCLKKEEEVVVAPVFREEKYLKFYRAELTAHRRNWSSEGYALEARKYAERSCKQSASLSLVDNDINSVRSLLKTAQVRCLLLNQKLQFVRDQICSLEAKSHSM